MFTSNTTKTNNETHALNSSRRSDLRISLENLDTIRSKSEEPRPNPELLKRLQGFKEKLSVDTDLAEEFSKSGVNPPPSSPVLLLRASPSSRRNAIADLNDIDASQNQERHDRETPMFCIYDTLLMAPSPHMMSKSGAPSPTKCFK